MTEELKEVAKKLRLEFSVRSEDEKEDHYNPKQTIE